MQSFNLRLLKQLLTASSPRTIGFKQNTRTDSFTSPKGATLRAVFHTSRQKRAARGSVYKAYQSQFKVRPHHNAYRTGRITLTHHKPNHYAATSTMAEGSNYDYLFKVTPPSHSAGSQNNSSLNRSYSLVTQVLENRTFFTSCINNYILRAFESNSNCTFSEVLGKKT